MKKTISLLLALFLLLPVFCSCSSGLATTETTQTKTTEEKETQVTPYLEFYSNNPEPLKQEQLDALPIASADLSPAQLRQLALDFFQLQLTFKWKSNIDIYDYPTTYSTKMKKSLETKYLYSGIPYQSQGTGNLYRWLEYYDTETGEMDLARALEENGGYGENAAITTVETDASGNITYKRYRSFMAMFNQCSVASYWGWGRVINSANFAWSYDINVYNGFIPVGGYTYPNMKTLDKFGVTTEGNPTAYDTDDVVKDYNKANGKDAFMACYLAAKPGDVLVSPGHVMMVKSVQPFYNNDGSVNYARSTMTIMDQGESWAIDDQIDGVPWRQQGSTEFLKPLSYYQKAGYIPFTCREFQDPADPADQKNIAFYDTYIKNNTKPLEACYSAFSFTPAEILEMSGGGVEKAFTFTTAIDQGNEISFEALKTLTVGANYPFSDVFVTVSDKDGKELKKNIYRAGSPRIRQVSMTATESHWKTDENGNLLNLLTGIEELAGAGNTLKITARISTGQFLTILERTLTK